MGKIWRHEEFVKMETESKEAIQQDNKIFKKENNLRQQTNDK